MSQPDFPEHFPFALDASFLPCAPGLAYTDPGKMLGPPLCSPHSASFDLTLGCILLLTRPVLVRKDFL